MPAASSVSPTMRSSVYRDFEHRRCRSSTYAGVGFVELEAGGNADRVVEQVLVAAVGDELVTMMPGSFEASGAVAVAEQHAGGRTVGVVEHARGGLRADDKRSFACSLAELVGDAERADEARVDVERSAAVPRAEAVLEQTRGRRR